MPVMEVLVLAVTKTVGGVCIAGMTADPDPVTGLRWVRPGSESGHVRLGDITTHDKAVIRPFDVVELDLLRPSPIPPHIEDWIADFARRRPRIVRRLEGGRRIGFLHKHLDSAPRQVLQSQQRSLCLIKPDWVKGCFRLNPHSGQFDARLSFGLAGRSYRGSFAKGGLSVSDLKWRALGRAWLPDDGGWTEFDTGDLEARLGVQEFFLVTGLDRSHEGRFQPSVAGVHTWPDYEAKVDYDNL